MYAACILALNPCFTPPGVKQIHCSYQVQRAEEKVNQLGRTWILYVPLQFGLQGAQTGTGSESLIGRRT